MHNDNILILINMALETFWFLFTLEKKDCTVNEQEELIHYLKGLEMNTG